DQMMWSPDNQWVAASVQDTENYTSHIVLINPNSGERRHLDSAVGQMQYPLGWLSATELLALAAKHEPIIEGDMRKQNVSEVSMYRVDLQNNQWVELGQNMDWTAHDEVVLSPDKMSLAYTTRDRGRLLVIMRADGASEKVLGAHGVMPAWAPNGEWIATIWPVGGGEVQVNIVHPDGTAPRNVFQGQGDFAMAVWLPGSAHLLIQTFEEIHGSETNALYLVSVEEQNFRPVAIPGFETGAYFISGISVRPMGHP
ncbi:MAG: hypothetical protein GY796_28790, partial [Chloroflexi bacterium]|nr:hypothetical protein [Chloroflexota bacterium]